MTWWQGRLVAFDLETTGVDVESDRIVTASVVACGAGLAPERMTLLADPGVEIPEGASAVHGVTTERARAEGLPARDVIQAAVSTLGIYVRDATLVVYNAPFDLTMLDREARRHGVVPLDLSGVCVVDPLVIDRHLDRFRSGSRKLEAVCEHHGVTLDGAHDSGHDALAAARLAWCLGARGEVVRRVRDAESGRELAALKREWERVRNDLGALHAAQALWAAGQARGLAEHFRRKGKPDEAASVRTEWPIVPWDAGTGDGPAPAHAQATERVDA